jgi:thiol-disulfide isomerase/thioredoxin/sugar lactone lactonase YvrE
MTQGIKGGSPVISIERDFRTLSERAIMFKRVALMIASACLSLALAAAAGAGRRALAQGNDSDLGKGNQEVDARQRGRVRAPELVGDRGWLNADKPLSLAALRGKVVLLDFWTYGCINCIHIIPDLQRLEEKYAKELVVIGVHSAKFDNEKETENIRRIILRYGIEHPVVNDADFRIWNSYAVNAWPTQVLIDPAGYVVGQVSGEGNYDVIDGAISAVVADFRKRGELDEQPLRLALERAKVGDLPLAFPGKILADDKADRLFIADSNHNRVVVTRLDGTLVETIGTGERGALDGGFDRATFHRPQGLALEGQSLYIADTENHTIRRADLKARTVSTVAGTGQQTRQYPPRGGPARATAISSPWDLRLEGQSLYIAMAGSHQIWKLDLKAQELSVFAGSAREARTDGPRAEAAFAQPSGLASDGRALFVADSESNIIRAIALSDDAPAISATSPTASLAASFESQVTTLAGGDLFEFGDRDGRGDDARFQHPLGALYHDGKIFIADTYNHKIKTLDPRTRAVRTFLGTGKSGQADGAAPTFYEPGGLATARGKLYVADTNNHAVRVIDLKTKQAATLKLEGLRPPDLREQTQTETDAEDIVLATQRLNAGAGGNGALVVDVKLPAGYHLNPAAPHRYKISLTGADGHLAIGGAGAAFTASVAKTAKDLRLPLRLPLRAIQPGATQLSVRLTLYYCREDNTGTCRIKTLAWRAPIEVTGGGDAPTEINVRGEIEQAAGDK